MSESNLFKPIQVGNFTLSHRVVMPPLTRGRADMERAHTSLGKEYYEQRSRIPGSFIVTEGVYITEAAGNYPTVPGLYTPKQVEAWRAITSAVHANGSFIFAQLWHMGRANGVGPSAIPITGAPAPHELTVAEIKTLVSEYVNAAKNAIAAGFDGVEIQGGNGFLVDQFLQSVSNVREDAYGGSPENRARFALEIFDAVSKAVGEDKTAIHIAPWGEYLDMGKGKDIATHVYLVKTIKEQYPASPYLHVTEARMAGDWDAESTVTAAQSNEPLRQLWAPKPFFIAGGFTRDSAIKAADVADHVLVGFGRQFIANPDLPRRLKENLPLNAYNRPTFYTPGPEGYTSYSFVEQQVNEARL